MSQPRSRSRKVVATDDGRPRPSFTVAKASGDTAAYTSRPNQETRRSRSKNKIPKSVRYDLENALVSLCDVWFEEIKPHLVRNNIKLHVHGSNASGDQERPLPSAPPSPTALRTLLVHPAPGCSHLDPGAASYHRLHRDASCIGCFSTPPTASRVLCPRPRAPSRRHIQAPVPSLRQTPCDSTQNCEEKQLKRPRNRRNQRRSQAQPQPQSSWRVPRLCRTYGALRPAATGSRAGRAGPRPPQPRDDYFRFIVPRHKTGMKNKSTQTKQPSSSVSTSCLGKDPEPMLNSSLLRRCIGSRSPKTHSPETRRARTSSPWMCSARTCSPERRNFILRSPGRSSQDRAPPAFFQRRHTHYRFTRPKQAAAKEPLPLFQDDLIDIIGARNDRRLRLLYNNPMKNDQSSFMNLVPLPIDRNKNPGGLKNSHPWR